MLDKYFSPNAFEGEQYQRSLNANAFAVREGKNNYTIMMPPPNVTGSLHIGHALTFTLQDILIRYHQMLGDATLWQAGTDHAGIATQMVVERMLNAEGKNRKDMGREAFLKRVWQWKKESGDTIVSQLTRLGAAADWGRGRFTLDDGLSAAVRKIFVSMYHDGLIYRDKRLVNWDVKLQTAISDLEVISEEITGAYYHITYPFVEGNGSITVATTRPETLLGDVAVAVHPDHPDLKKHIGRHVHLPLTDRIIPIIADAYADPEKGTGAVKITPAHDFNDFEVGKRHGLAPMNILNPDGTLNENTPMPFCGMDRFVARKAMVAALEEQGLLVSIEQIKHTVPHGDRSGTVIEPFLTEQWYVRANILAKPALQAVADGVISFVPENWENTYNHWLNEENIQPWCISRQLWWGHRIPAWYDEEGTIYVAETEEAAQRQAGDKNITQDHDVLDTWFSAGLWPFSTLGWPEDTDDLKKHYPTSVLVTGFDIIFFWVARMIMMGIYAHAKPLGFFEDLTAGKAIAKDKLAKAIPFKDVYIHALVRDKNGQKMSKSKGNVVDPLELIDKYGADALRFTLAIMAAQGRDVKLDVARIEGYRNFATKLWNAARFGEMNGCVLVDGFDPKALKEKINQEYVGALAHTAAAVEKALDHYKFNEAADALYQFIWNDFCDWYVEFSKSLFQGESGHETRATFAWILKTILHLLHPFMPFITDEIAEKLGYLAKPLILENWPILKEYEALQPHFILASHNTNDTTDETTMGDVDQIKEIIKELRSVRAILKLPASDKIRVRALFSTKEDQDNNKPFLEKYKAIIVQMAGLKDLELNRPPQTEQLRDATEKKSILIYFSKLTYISKTFGLIIILDENVNTEELNQRLIKDIEKIDADLNAVLARLRNEGFVAKAAPETLAEHEQRKTDYLNQKTRLMLMCKDLSGQ